MNSIDEVFADLHNWMVLRDIRVHRPETGLPSLRKIEFFLYGFCVQNDVWTLTQRGPTQVKLLFTEALRNVVGVFGPYQNHKHPTVQYTFPPMRGVPDENGEWTIETTDGQLRFFAWFLRNHLLHTMMQHIDEVNVAYTENQQQNAMADNETADERRVQTKRKNLSRRKTAVIPGDSLPDFLFDAPGSLPRNH